jgi:hypothetical protein
MQIRVPHLVTLSMLVAASWPGLNAQQQNAPELSTASVITSTQPNQLSIRGSNFGTVRPTVMLDNFALSVSSNTDTTVVAYLPANATPGTYRLALINNSLDGNPSVRTGTLDVTIGGAGPVGPQGPAGPQGIQGIQGVPGPQGPAGSNAGVTLATVCATLGYFETASCQANLSPKVVFVTAATFSGNLGGLAGADQKCQLEAKHAGLNGTYRAWLSGSESPVGRRLTHSVSPYYLPNDAHTLVANNFGDLILNNLHAAINVKADGTAAPATPGAAWTGTNADGSASTATCGSWTTDDQNQTTRGFIGLYGETGPQWSSEVTALCPSPLRLYCFQQ